MLGRFQDLRSKGLKSETGQGGEVIYPLGEPGATGDHRLPGPMAMVLLTRCLPSHLQVGFHSLSYLQKLVEVASLAWSLKYYKSSWTCPSPRFTFNLMGIQEAHLLVP